MLRGRLLLLLLYCLRGADAVYVAVSLTLLRRAAYCGVNEDLNLSETLPCICATILQGFSCNIEYFASELLEYLKAMFHPD